MAGNNGPKIITSGLKLLLDPQDLKSYPGSGNVWTDLAQGLKFNSGGTQTPLTTIKGSKCFDFNGSGYWECSVGNDLVDLGGPCTVIFWIYGESLTPLFRRSIFQKNGTIYQPYQQELAIVWESNSSGSPVVNSFSYYSGVNIDGGNTGTAITLGAWNMISFKFSTGRTTSLRTGFWSYNGNPWISNFYATTTTAIVSAGAISIGKGYENILTAGYLAGLICYDRMLSDAEIKQNFNAQRGRYGL